jgi:hypothetical protein
MLFSAPPQFNQTLNISMRKPVKIFPAVMALLIAAGFSGCNRRNTAQSDIKYEYRVVSSIPLNTSFQSMIDQMAGYGWRLIQVTERISRLNGEIQEGRRDAPQSITLSCDNQYNYIFERPKK